MVKMVVHYSLIVVAVVVVFPPKSVAAAPPVRDVVFATPDSHELRLDLFLPEDTKNPPLVVFIHGGGWVNNSYKKCLTPRARSRIARCLTLAASSHFRCL